MAAEVDEHLGTCRRVFRHLSPGAGDAAVTAVVGAWWWWGPRARKGCLDHEARDGDEELPLWLALRACLTRQSQETATVSSGDVRLLSVWC